MTLVAKANLAITDLEEQATYLNRESHERGLHFLAQAEHTFTFLGKTPDVGRPLDSLRTELLGVRVWPVGDFRKHLVFYRPTEDGIEVLRVLHGMRDLESLL
jgi:toxin ParE1/3/4